MRKIMPTGKVETPSKKRPGVHAKTKNATNPRSKHYRKKYRGQGKP